MIEYIVAGIRSRIERMIGNGHICKLSQTDEPLKEFEALRLERGKYSFLSMNSTALDTSGRKQKRQDVFGQISEEEWERMRVVPVTLELEWQYPIYSFKDTLDATEYSARIFLGELAFQMKIPLGASDLLVPVQVRTDGDISFPKVSADVKVDDFTYASLNLTVNNAYVIGDRTKIPSLINVLHDLQT